MDSKEALDALEGRVVSGELLRLSTEKRRTKAILYRTLEGRSVGLEIGNAHVEVHGQVDGGFLLTLPDLPRTYPTRVILVLERAPPGRALHWDEAARLPGVALLAEEQFKSTAYQTSGARLEEGRQQSILVETQAGLSAILGWYGAPHHTIGLERAVCAIRESGSKREGHAVNLILYGPPGTGKTYATAAEAVRLCDGEATLGSGATRRRYDELVKRGQIRFVTFHQSYAYEDFVEGLRPTTGDTEEGHATVGFRLVPVPGIFREIADLAEQARKAARDGLPGVTLDFDGRRFWKMALGAKGSEEHVYQAAIAGDYVALGWGSDVDWSDARFSSLEAMRQEWASRYPDDKTASQTSQPWAFRNAMKVGDIIVVPFGNSAFRAVAKVTGEYFFRLMDDGTYNHRRKVEWLLVPDKPLPLDAIIEGNFTMRTLYEIPQQRVRKEAMMRLLSGTPSTEPGQRRPDQFVLIIDEINRANVSKVFGEMITLLEADKRLGETNALTVTLPYSGNAFGVPSNLHVVGTMNTADRSIALLDTALRRRFAFRELAPQPNLLSTDVEGIDLRAVLTTLNSRVEYLVDREHRIGHAFFMHCLTRQDVDEVMRERIIPLLAEYFFEDWERIRLVLGEETDEGAFLGRKRLGAPRGMEEQGPERWQYLVKPIFAEKAYEQFAA